MYEMKLRVTMLGTFSLSWRRKPVDLENAGAKVLQVWQALLYAGSEGVSRDELQNRLYGYNDDETANSLRALVFRLRRFLTSRGLDGANSVRVRGGIYYWTGPQPQVDAHRYVQAAEKALAANGPSRTDLLLKAVTLYSGQLLPASSDEVIRAEGDRLEQLYLKCLRELTPVLRQENRLEELLELSTRASKILPMDEEWTLTQLDCMITLGRCEEAMQVYQQAVERLATEQGISPSDALMGRFKELCVKLRFSLSDLATVQADLWEKAISSSYYCSYPSFVDCYRVASRHMARDKGNGVLMLCTLTDTTDVPMQKGSRQQNAVNALQLSIGQSLRGGDIYTCYSPNQYLILLMGMKLNDCDGVSRRIRDTFTEQSASWGCRLRFESAPATAPTRLPRHGAQENDPQAKEDS